MRRLIVSIGCLLAVVFCVAFLGGCGGKAVPGKSVRASSDCVLRLAIGEDFFTLDPALITDVAAGSLSAKIFDGLVRFDLKGKIASCLARRWRTSEDGTVYSFDLRDDVFFHNGRKMTSADVRWSFQRLLDPAAASPRRWVLDKIAGAKEYRGAAVSGPLKGIETPNERTVILKLEKPFAPFLSLLAMPNACVVPMEEIRRHGESFGRRPVGTGPFILDAWDRDQRLCLKKNARYFGGAPSIDGVEYRIIPEPWAVLTEFTQGKLDWISVPQGNLEQFLADPSLSCLLKSAAGLNTYYLGFNCAKPPLDRAAVRQALTMAVDRKKIVEKLIKARAVPANGPVPPVLDAGLAGEVVFGYDPQRARRILQEEGLKDLRLTLYQTSSLDTLEVMEVIQNNLAKIGVRVDIQQREWSSFKEAVVRGRPDMFFLSWWADYPDVENFLAPNFCSANAGAGGNKSRFADPEFDRLMALAQTQTDAAQRQALYRECVLRIVRQCPWLFLWHRIDWVAVQPWVKGLELGSVYNADKFTAIRLEKPKEKME